MMSCEIERDGHNGACRERLMFKSCIPDRHANFVCLCVTLCADEGRKGGGCDLEGGRHNHCIACCERNKHILCHFIMRHMYFSGTCRWRLLWPLGARLHVHTILLCKLNNVILTAVTPQTRSRSLPTHLFGPYPSFSQTSTRRRFWVSP